MFSYRNISPPPAPFFFFRYFVFFYNNNNNSNNYNEYNCPCYKFNSTFSLSQILNKSFWQSSYVVTFE